MKARGHPLKGTYQILIIDFAKNIGVIHKKVGPFELDLNMKAYMYFLFLS